MRSIFLIAFIGMVQLAFSQNHYSFISDRKFTNPDDLIGYRFMPNEVEVDASNKEAVKAGDVSFGLTANNLFVQGEGIQGVYSISGVAKTKYGYKLDVMNANNPLMQGRLKVFLNEHQQVDALMFKRSQKDNEVVYFQAAVPSTTKAQEEEFFTDLGEIVITQLDSLWGKKVFPFLVYNESSDIQQRLQIEDNVYIEFLERSDITESTRKPERASSGLLSSKGTDEAESKHLKISKERYLKLNIHFKDAGEKEFNRSLQYKIDKANWKKDKKTKEMNIVLKSKGQSDIVVHLDEKNAVRSITVDERAFFMRGF